MDKPNFYAIIPANVRYDTDLKANSKLLYGEITALCNEKGYCWATNSYFANLYNVSKETISRWIKDLCDKGYIHTQLIYKEGTKEIEHRYLKLGSTPIDEKINTYCEKNQKGIDEKINTPIDEKVKDNITVFNNTFNNKKKKETEFDIVINNFTKDEELRKAIYDFLKHRKAMKSAMTTSALKMILNKLKSISLDKREQIEIINNSIMKGYKDIFPLEEKKASTKASGFNNFESRQYDYDSLEKKLLGWDK